MGDNPVCDHAVATRLTLAGPHLTKIRVMWLVDQNAAKRRITTFLDIFRQHGVEVTMAQAPMGVGASVLAFNS